jgi:Tfp pilus assembly major pilin PilA
MSLIDKEPVRLVVVAIVAVLAALQGLDVIEVDAVDNIVSALTLIVGGEVARSKVRPVR